MRSRPRPLVLLSVLLAVIALGACQGDVATPKEQWHTEVLPGHGAEAAAEPAHQVHVEGAERWTQYLSTVPVELTRGAEELDPQASFQVVTRVDQLTQHPCSQCHEGSEIVGGSGTMPDRAHWNVQAPHGAADLTCATCHPAENPGSLADLAGRPVSFDQPHQLCGTCHFEQLRDWIGGAHGKRMHAWAGPRVVQSCTGCHNPHDPGFPVRLPSITTPPPEAWR